jgi:hypothetical protein
MKLLKILLILLAVVVIANVIFMLIPDKLNLGGEMKITAENEEEYEIVSCCDRGILSAKTAKNESDYTAEFLKTLILELYYSNCDLLKNYKRQQVYLDGSNQELGESRNNLIYYEDLKKKVLVIRGTTIEEDFFACT